jgi:hypothetical protein
MCLCVGPPGHKGDLEGQRAQPVRGGHEGRSAPQCLRVSRVQHAPRWQGRGRGGGRGRRRRGPRVARRGPAQHTNTLPVGESLLRPPAQSLTHAAVRGQLLLQKRHLQLARERRSVVGGRSLAGHHGELHGGAGVQPHSLHGVCGGQRGPVQCRHRQRAPCSRWEHCEAFGY